MATYAVKWREADGHTFVGRLALGAHALHLIGRMRGADGPTVDRRIGYSELRGVRIGRGGAERVDGRPALVVEGSDGAYLVVDAGMGMPMVHEVVDRLGAL